MPEWLLFASLPLLILSLTVHELAHGLVADALGDPTARIAGRLSANPIRHLDPIGTVVLVGTLLASGGSFMFGWAKPVPVDPRQFKSQRKGMAIVGAAGPLSNLGLAIVAGLAARAVVFGWHTLGRRALENADLATWQSAAHVVADAWYLLYLVFLLNLILAVFNLLPIPPLDGSKVLGGLLPEQAYHQWSGLDRYGNLGFLVLIALSATGVVRSIMDPVVTFSQHLLLTWKW